MTDHPDRLLPRVKRVLTGWTMFTWPNASRILRDGNDVEYALLTKHSTGQTYTFAAKRALNGGRDASFMPRLVEQALGNHAILGLFVGEEPSMGTAYAFNPERVKAYGKKRAVNSKQERGVTVLDVNVGEHGALLGDYLAGRADLPGPDELPSSVQPDLDAWGSV